MMCNESLSPDVDQARRTLGVDQPAPESKEVVKDAFDVVINKKTSVAFKYFPDPLSVEFGSWVDSVLQFANMFSVEACTVHHTLTLFINYIHPMPDILTKSEWDGLHWQRFACLWIALKFCDADYDNIELFVTSEKEKKLLIDAEMEVMRGLNYNMAKPPDYMYMLSVLLEVSPVVMDQAYDFLLGFIRMPAQWYAVPHVKLCSACIVAAREHLDGRCTDLPTEAFVKNIVDLGVDDIESLLYLSGNILQYN
jgi:hypothetical protein